MRNIKLTLEYDGTDFSGFQLQPKRVTIQETLEGALSKLFNKPMKIKSASGRTDAGVHAKCQVVNFEIDRTETLWQIQKGLNAHLPHSIAVKKAEEVNSKFHARFSAKRKTYEYLVWNDPARSPFYEKYAVHVMSPLSLAKMRKAAKVFVGKHDFRSFCATGKPAEQKKDTVRHIYQFTVKMEGPLVKFQITGNGFLHYMVRNIVGMLIEVGRGKILPEEVSRILKSRDRRKAPATAPAKALTLMEVIY